MIKKFKLFLSCGQNNNEKDDGKKIKEDILDKLSNKVDVFLAETTYTYEGVTETIYKELQTCDAFIAILHKRNLIEEDKEKSYFNSSLFVNQEIAIASFLRKPSKYYAMDDNIFVEGVRRYLLNRDIIKEYNEMIEDIIASINEWIDMGMYNNNNKINFNKPIIRNITNYETIRTIEIQFTIDNNVPTDFNTIHMGIILPKDIRFGPAEMNEIVKLSGKMTEFFESVEEINHYRYSFHLPGILFWEQIFSISFPNDLDCSKFHIGIYIINKDIGTHIYKLLIVKPNSEYPSIGEFSESNEKIRVHIE